MKSFKVDNLNVKVFSSRKEMGDVSAKDIAEEFKRLLSEKAEINVIFAAAPSQNDVLSSLINDKSIEWGRINAFHMDEYVGLSADAPQGFGNFLKDKIFGKVPFKSVNYIDSKAQDPEKEAERYGALIEKNRPDVVIMGIGENGHIAFNDPPVADFNDEKVAKVVKLDEVCRNQQVHDGCFKDISLVPKYAITLTVPTLASAPCQFCIVPAPTKAQAVYSTLNGKIGKEVPATVLRTAKNATLYLDGDSSALLKL